MDKEIKEENNTTLDETRTEENAGEKRQEKKSVVSDPDQNGVRFYNIDSRKELSKKSKLKKNLIIFGVILVVFIIIGALFNSFGFGIMSSGGTEYPTDPYIARLDISGVISEGSNTDYFGTPIGYQHRWTLDTIDDLIYDDNNKGIVFFVDSPGGGVYESDELYFKIKEYQEKTGRPVYSAMGSMAASGGYYISAPCDKIIANRNTWTGSIGVTMGTMFDFSDFLATYGVKTNTITSGVNKSMGSMVDPMSQDQKAIFQSLVDEAYEQFVELVADGRNLEVQKVKEIADGRIYTANQALNLGLIDKIGTIDEAVDDMKKTYNLQECEFVELSYQSYSVLGSIFGEFRVPSLGSNSDVSNIMQIVNKSGEFPISYMCEALNN